MMVRRVRALGVWVLVAAGCGPQVAVDSDDPPATGTDGGPEDPPPETSAATLTTSGPPPSTTGMGPTTAPPATTADSRDDGFDSSTFLDWDTDSCGIEPPEGTSFHCTPVECDPFAQDCSDGEKCMPWANDGGPVWNSFRCTPVAANPNQTGEACEVEGSAVSGIDDCDVGLMCFWVDPDTLEGACVPLCGGSQQAPTCPDDGYCTISESSRLTVCLQTCDPIADDCPAGHCVPLGEELTCQGVVPGDGAPGEPCDFPQECATGSTCISAEAVEGCDSVGCCASWCDLTAAEPDALCLPGQTCVPWWERGEAPESLSHVGVCAVPQ